MLPPHTAQAIVDVSSAQSRWGKEKAAVFEALACGFDAADSNPFSILSSLPCRRGFTASWRNEIAQLSPHAATRQNTKSASFEYREGMVAFLRAKSRSDLPPLPTPSFSNPRNEKGRWGTGEESSSSSVSALRVMGKGAGEGRGALLSRPLKSVP